ncbi:toxin-antitoxin system YwqK family antitoxin [Brevibacillus sp. NPDC003359]|uniref:toxin-antitoxin system YwqK family antitoxin n=1 Tax=unclassified Brevibacillus TaxID=2684853 RepID=UPI0036B7ECF9
MMEFNLLSLEKVLLEGIEFADEVCFSGKSGQEVFDKPIEDGGKPVSGLLYERYKNGNLVYYSYYKNGVAEGDYVKFYENGKVESFQRMNKGVILGKSTSWYENGVVKSIAECKYGFRITYREWNIDGELITEKIEPSEFEKEMIDKYDKWAEQDGK